MSELTWIDPRVDRSKWPRGAWDGEPDKAQWIDAATGFVCLAKRHATSGHWCGYVGVEPSHPWEGKGCNSCEADVHGGVTFGNYGQEGPPEQTVCHVPEPGKPEHLFWIGFDCHHAWDCSPEDMVRAATGDRLWAIGYDESYKSLAYVKRECASLARQAAELKGE